ncbi:MAG: PRC-barrel domain-containing protein [Burkholderiaceae bacterium]|jgi:sporulation protein YlmC with PRC-barrel domain|nr:PRC-barrel domain-containing protein [Burkholderiaceae bacterium]MBJ7419246.1 PRC-barrel domain-containing protein [Rhodoferax sp.]
MNTLDLNVGNVSTSSSMVTSDQVEGATVYNQQGEKLGSIKKLIIEKQSGQVRYAALEFGGLFGMGANKYPLPWKLLKYNTSLDGYVVPITKEQLDNAPMYEGDVPPDYSEEYSQKVNNHYNAF